MWGWLERVLPALMGLCAVALLWAAPAQATSPGQNGKIAYSDGGDIWVMNPDGTAKTQLTSGPETDFGPDWSPDGTKIAFSRFVSGSNSVYTMGAAGGNVALITDGREPSWSPGGTRIAYTRAGRIWTVDADGSNPSDLVINGFYTEDEKLPHWSPNGTEIAFFACTSTDTCENFWNYGSSVVPASGGTHTPISIGTTLDWSPDGRYLLESIAGEEMNRIRREDGGGQQFIRYGPQYASWSPDGSKIVVDDLNTGEVIVIDADGSNPASLGAGTTPDWQSMPVIGYPRPLAAHPLQVSLVPAYQPCTAPNRTHGTPLAFPSCAPPTRTPSQLTVGTRDSNGMDPKGTANVFLSTLIGDPTTAADEADVRLRATVTDVRLASDLSDYTGALEARMTLRITDKDNTAPPGGPGPATVVDTTYSFPVPCTPTENATIGSRCEVDTTAEALVAGIAKERRRAIWELGQITLHDGAGDAFMRQGVFVP